jgi:23S rRNA (pseudouridine1915-N3)-methyltransferase
VRQHLIAVGSKMPGWVTAGYDEYAKRLRGELNLQLHEIPAGKRGKNADIARITADEGKRMLDATPGGAHVVALDVLGKSWSTEQLSDKLDEWMRGGRDVALYIGGPEGLAPEALARADERWSLSALTFPHPLVRVILAEQLYRAHSLLRGHPYHRAG